MQEADDWARAFKGPVRLVWGRRDPILGRTIYSMKKLFPDAEVTETGAGHFLQEEVPEELADAILKTVREPGGDKPRPTTFRAVLSSVGEGFIPSLLTPGWVFGIDINFTH